MSQSGQIVARVYISQMTIPIVGANVFIHKLTADDKKTQLIAMRTTTQNGESEPVIIDTPDEAESQTPREAGEENPFASVNIFIEAPGFQSVLIHDAQVFSKNITVQNVEMVPLAEPQIREADVVTDVYVTPQAINSLKRQGEKDVREGEM